MRSLGFYWLSRLLWLMLRRFVSAVIKQAVLPRKGNRALRNLHGPNGAGLPSTHRGEGVGKRRQANYPIHCRAVLRHSATCVVVMAFSYCAGPLGHGVHSRRGEHKPRSAGAGPRCAQAQNSDNEIESEKREQTEREQLLRFVHMVWSYGSWFVVSFVWSYGSWFVVRGRMAYMVMVG